MVIPKDAPPSSESSLPPHEDLASLAGRCKMPSEVRSGNGMTRLNWILNLESPEEFVEGLATGELYYMMQNIGLADSRVLLEFSSEEQLRGMLDLDVWTGHQPRVDRWVDWVKLASTVNVETAYKVVQATEAELIQLLFTGELQVHPHDLDLDTVSDDLQLVPSPDGAFWVTIPHTHELATELHPLLKLFWAADGERMRDIFQTSRFELPSQVEETLIHFRQGRLEEMGFTGPQDALTVYAYLDPIGMRDKARHSLEELQPLNTGAQAASAEDIILRDIATPDTLANALMALDERTRSHFIEAFTYVLNKVFMAQTGDLSETDRIPAIGKHCIALVNLGLLYLSDDSPNRATEILPRIWPEKLFRVGYSLLMELSKRTRSVCSRSGAYLGLTLFGSPQDEALEGFSRLRPVFFEGLEQKEAVTWKDFADLGELSQAELLITDADELLRFFEDHFNFSPGTLLSAHLGGVSEDIRKAITFQTLFRTGLVQVILTDNFSFEPLRKADFVTFLDIAFELENETVAFSPNLQRVLDELKAHLSPSLSRWVEKTMDELALALGRVQAFELDARYATELILVHPDDVET